MEFITKLFSSEGFMPHGHCYFWNPSLVRLHVLSDALIALAYLTIPVTLIYVARKRKDLPFDWIFACFAIFIIACGATHALEIWTIWYPTYWLSGTMKAITAAASVTTAILLVRLIPRLLALPSPSILREANSRLRQEAGERTRAEETLKELSKKTAQRERILTTMLSSVSDFAYIFDREGRFLFANQALLHLWGIPLEEAVGKKFVDLGYPDELAAKMHRQIEEVFETRASITDETPYTNPAGLKGCYEYIFSPAFAADGTVEFVVGSTRDITERQEAANALLESKHFLRSALDALPSHIAILDESGTIIEVNAAWNRYAKENGFKGGHSVGMNYLKVCDVASGNHAKEAPEVAEGIRAVIAGQCSQFQVEYPCHSPREKRWFLVRVTRFGGDGPVRLAVEHENITARKQAEESLVLFRTLIDQSNDVIEVLDATDYRYLDMNETACIRHGYTREEMLAMSVGDIDPDLTPELRERVERELKTSGSMTIESRHRRKDGSIFPVEVTIKLVQREKGYIVTTVRDITERKRAELELRAAKEAAEAASIAKSRFLANMSHEIRTPMNGVIGMTGLLLRTPLSPEQRDFTETIRASGESLLTVINDILDFSKVEAGKLALETLDFDLQEVVEGTVELLAETAAEKALDLCGFTHPSVPTHLRGDPGRLRQVLMNLVGNAIKFTAEGEVALSVELTGETETHATLAFRVRDTGVGISPEAQSRLFQAFTQADVSTTRKYGGTGLGLALSKQLIERMGGEIGLESAEGAGSTFWFILPFEKQARAHRPREAGHLLEGVRVLLVDDHPTNLENLQEQLAAWKIPSEKAGDGASALACLRAAAPTQEPFAAALIDQGLPGMDGLELARTIQGDPAIAATRLVLLATRGQPLAEEEILRAGIRQSRLKPVRQSQLFDCLVNALADSPAMVTAASRPALPPQVRHRERILLAEDNAVNQRVALGQLRQLGYTADAVANGFEALKMLAVVPYDIVLMDCHMPEIDGYEATAAIRQREGTRKRTWIIAMTANAMTEDREQCLAAGMDDYVGKPVRLEDLDAVLKRARQHIAAAPAIDPRSLEELRKLPDEGDQDILQHLLLKFTEDASTAMAGLIAAVADGDARAAAFSAHALKGSSSLFGAHRLQELCGELERDGKAGKLDRLPNLLTQTEAELQRVLTALNRELELQPS
jgi:PAS domain S-box-containing protein